MSLTSMFETPEAEAARLAQSPVGSRNHTLSTMPVNIHEWVQDLMIELPRLGHENQHRVVVVPSESRGGSERVNADGTWQLHTGSWTCIVIASDHPNYPVGGHRIIVPEHQLVRGIRRTLAD